jgi:hypothetical protein
LGIFVLPARLKSLAFDEFSPNARLAFVTLCGPDGLRFPCSYSSLELLSPGLTPAEGFMILEYRRKRDLE